MMDALVKPRSTPLPAFKKRAPHGRTAGPILTTSPLVRMMFEEIDKQWLPLRTLSAICGSRMTSISDWRAGRHYPRIDKVERILDYLQVEIPKLEKRP